MIGELLTVKNAFVPTPSDTVDFTQCKYGYLYVGGAGNVSVVTHGGDTVLLQGVLAGSLLPLKIKRVMVTGLTATNLVVMHNES